MNQNVNAETNGVCVKVDYLCTLPRPTGIFARDLKRAAEEVLSRAGVPVLRGEQGDPSRMAYLNIYLEFWEGNPGQYEIGLRVGELTLKPPIETLGGEPPLVQCSWEDRIWGAVRKNNSVQYIKDTLDNLIKKYVLYRREMRTTAPVLPPLPTLLKRPIKKGGNLEVERGKTLRTAKRKSPWADLPIQ